MAGKKKCGGCGGSRTPYRGFRNTDMKTTQWVRMEYTGTSKNKKSFARDRANRVSFRRTYAGSTTSNKFIDAHPDDVEGLKHTGEWKVCEPPEVEKPETETKPKQTRSKKASSDS